MFCDLHTHSYYSDGSGSPEELIRRAQERQLSAVALCDHNTIDGVPEFLRAADGCAVEAIAGAEFSADYNVLNFKLTVTEDEHIGTFTNVK